MKYSYIIATGISLFLLTFCSENEYKTFIAVNQVGYETNDHKTAFMVNAGYSWFELINTSDGLVVYSDSITQHRKADLASGDSIGILNFSNYKSVGKYYLRMRENHSVRSSEFNLAPFVYEDALQTVIRSFYYHRCGTSVDLGNEWNYEICHLDDAPFYDKREQHKDVTGGWHDAGDYNKFTVNTALSASLLLYTFAEHPERFTDDHLAIPESGNGIPDILDEISWALRWLLKMQRDDGSVYHKVSQKKWIGEYLPHEDPSDRYIFEPSSAATASFAATTALGARLLYPYNPEFASNLHQAAEDAWAYLGRNITNVPLGGFKNPPDVSGGEYGDTDDRDERLWASVELYNLTRDQNYIDYFLRNYHTIQVQPLQPISWRNASSLAIHAFYFSDTGELYAGSKADIHRVLIKHADNLLDIRSKNNYRNLLRHTEYYWGSNSVGLAYSHDLINAWKITGNEEYREAAMDQLHYVMGRNSLNLSQITGVGTLGVQSPYHQLSEVGGFKTPIPGMLAGGPNNFIFLNDEKLSPYPAKSFEDSFKNYFVSEPAINFTAILAFVLSSLSDYPQKHSVLE